jgi:uncharacterized protein (TIGR02001 family)
MMKRMAGVLAAVMVLVVSWNCNGVSAADVTAGIDLNSAYVWRGMTFNDGAVLQPSLDVSHGGFGVNVWANMDLDDYDDTLDQGEFSEVDLTLSYSWTMGSVDAGIGYIEYLFPTTDAGGAPGTREIYLTLGTGLPAGFSTELGVYYDFDEVDDYYAVLGLGYGIALTGQLGLEAGASVGYAGDEYCGDGSAGFYDFSLSLALVYAVTESFSIGGKIVYADSLDDDNLVDIDDGGPLDVKTLVGITLSYAF